MVRLVVLPSTELWIGEMRPLCVQGVNIVIMRLEGGIVAYKDRCPHLGVPISRGTLVNEVLTCSAHQFAFDAKTGCGINPSTAQLEPVAVSEDGDRITVAV